MVKCLIGTQLKLLENIHTPYYLLCIKKLVLEKAWLKARKTLGYNDNFKNKTLMEVF